MVKPRNRQLIQSLFRLTRFGNLVIIGLAQYFTALFLISKHTLTDPRLFMLSLATMLIAAGGYAINDYYDVKIDYINKPDRVVIGKSVTRRHAILFHTILSILGCTFGLYVSWKIAAINIVSAFLLWLYSNSLKRLAFVGNFTVALMTGLSILIVDVYYQSGNAHITVYAAFAFFMTLVREIIKDMEDLKGDHTFGCKTLPIVLGMRKTKFTIYGILLLFAIAVIALSPYYAPLLYYYYLIFLFVLLVILLYRLIRADTKRDFARLSNFCKLIMLLGILSMAFI